MSAEQNMAVYDHVINKCGCQYIKHERAFSAFITMRGYDWQEYGLTEHDAKKKLATNLSKSKYILDDNRK